MALSSGWALCLPSRLLDPLLEALGGGREAAAFFVADELLWELATSLERLEGAYGGAGPFPFPEEEAGAFLIDATEADLVLVVALLAIPTS